MYPEKYFDNLYLIQKLGNIYDFRNDPMRTKILLYIYNAVAFVVCDVYYAVDVVWIIPKLSSNMYLTMEHIGKVFIIYSGMAKMLACLLYKNKLTELIRLLEDKTFTYEDFEGFRPGEATAECKRSVRKILYFVWIVMVLMPLFKVVVGLVNLVRRGNAALDGGRVCHDYLPFSSDIPFPSDTILLCTVGVVFMGTFAIVYTCQWEAGDLTFVGIALFVRCQLINLNGAFRTVRQRCQKRIGLTSSNLNVLNDEEVPLLKKEIDLEVRKMSQHLQLLMYMIEELETIFNLVFLSVMLCTMFVLVTCLYNIGTVDLHDPIFYSQIHFALAVMLQFMPYCYISNELTNETAAIAYSIYESDWFSCTKSVKTTMLIHMTRLVKPIYLSIGKFSPLTLNTYVQVLKGAYSYYTFIRRMN